jgi:hypothetical protein
LLFSALPGGNRNTDGTFNNVGSNGNWWSATQSDSSNAYNRNMNATTSTVNRNSNAKANSYSVRCVQHCATSGDGIMPSPLFIELHKAYLDARKNKRNTINQLKLECNLESELLSLERELLNKTYELRPSVCFINELPVKREIIAADFRDRIIHHFIYNRIYPVLDKKFIYDSYSCRVGKGTLFGIKRVQKFVKSCRNSYVLRLDIQGFFMAIDRKILYELTMAKLPGEELTEFLIKKIIFNEPLKNAIYKSIPSAWDDLPKDKTLKHSRANCGLPIGNLTSQVFANVYLNPLDHFIKRDLKIKLYGRYVDDLVLVHNDKQILLNSILQIRKFMLDNLKLTLHPKKIRLQPASKGFSFLGAYIYPNYLKLGKRIEHNFRERIFKPNINKGKQARMVQSYLGLLKHF